MSPSSFMTANYQAAQAKVTLCHQSPGRYFFRSFLAGVFLTFGGLIAIFAANYFADHAGMAKLIYTSLFPWGLVMIIFMNTELATSNMMYLTSATLEGEIQWGELVKTLLMCLLGNLLGSVLLALALGYSSAFQAVQADHYLFTVVTGKFNKSLGTVFLDAILANMLVNTAILGANRMRDDWSKIVFIFGPIAIFVLFGFEHVIANFASFSLAHFLAGNYRPDFTWPHILIHWLITFIGNYIGGGLIMGGGYQWLNHRK
ncbi:formate/nitrite transporter family protein [Hutsoniella sourekii]